MRTRSVLLHLANVLLPALWFVHARGFWLFPASALLFFALFALFHDVLHASLRLPKGLNEALLTVLGWSIGVSGHATRVAHLRHHAHPFGPDDLEGRGSRGSWWRALLMGPRGYLALPGYALARARREQRRVMLLEWLALTVFAIGLVSSESGRAYLAVALAFQLTIPVWGARLPHDPPRWMLALAAPLARTEWILAISLVAHERHHAMPKRTTFELLANQRSNTSGRVTREAFV